VADGRGYGRDRARSPRRIPTIEIPPGTPLAFPLDRRAPTSGTSLGGYRWSDRQRGRGQIATNNTRASTTPTSTEHGESWSPPRARQATVSAPSPASVDTGRSSTSSTSRRAVQVGAFVSLSSRSRPLGGSVARVDKPLLVHQTTMYGHGFGLPRPRSPYPIVGRAGWWISFYFAARRSCPIALVGAGTSLPGAVRRLPVSTRSTNYRFSRDAPHSGIPLSTLGRLTPMSRVVQRTNTDRPPGVSASPFGSRRKALERDLATSTSGRPPQHTLAVYLRQGRKGVLFGDRE
jgi:hypothetical protein